MNSFSKDEDAVRALIERSRSMAIDLAAAKERELERRLYDVNSQHRIRELIVTYLRRFPLLYRFLAHLKQRIS